MEFLYQDARSPTGRFLAHSEKRNDSRTGRVVFVLQLIDLPQNTVVSFKTGTLILRDLIC